MSRFSEYKHGHLSDEEYRAACAEMNREEMADRYRPDEEEDDDEED